MITTLTQRALSLSSVRYSFIGNILSVELETSTPHKILGSVNVTLANVQNTNLIDVDGSTLSNFFNSTFLFRAVSSTKLLYTKQIKSGLNNAYSLITLPNNGSSITATVNNLSLSNLSGKYCFRLIDSADSVFDGALINFKETDIASDSTNSYNGMTDSYSNLDDGDIQSIDNKVLTFLEAWVLTVTGNTSNTNIQLKITPWS